MTVATHKYNYGIIGNCAYLALVDDKANIGWLCMPRFDSSFLFGTLLDEEKGGGFSIQPAEEKYTSYQKYIPNTNVLETYFEAEDGSFKVVDFAPRFHQYERYYKPLMLGRKIVPIEGTPKVRVRCRPVGEYGAVQPKMMFGSNHIRYMGLEQQVRLTSDVPLNFIEQEQAFKLNEARYMILTWGIPLEAALESTAETFLKKTIDYWTVWAKGTHVEQMYQKEIIRSALTLKLHQYEDTGAIIAAATTSLPESPGSGRNWDYRYCWLRDAHYTLRALNDLSHFAELEKYAEFIENIALSEDNRYHPLYTVSINHRIEEEELPLAGYKGNQPVRVGNQAYEHIQNDVYGQVLVTLLPLFADERLVTKDKSSMVSLIMQGLRNIERTMDEPDNGIWEFRNKRQLHCYTFLFHWAGSKAALKIAKQIGHKEMEEKASALVHLAKEKIEQCYDEERGGYTQAIGSPNMDASLLQLINMGYLDAHSERAKKHLELLEKHLLTKEGLFYRYKHEDDFGEPESTFLICAFWYVEALARVGRVEEAVAGLDKLIPYANHLGLFSEDIHAKTGSQWGNFPQTYSHTGLINAAFAISRRMDKQLYL